MKTVLASYDMRAGEGARWGGHTPQVTVTEEEVDGRPLFVVRSPWGHEQAYEAWTDAERAAKRLARG